ncbi:MAG: hypothetical protein ACMUJM_06920 [bacterium]
MKLKSLLIIFLIVGCFMAVTAVRPAAAADFTAEVSISSEFNESTKTMRSTTDGTAPPLKADDDIYYEGKAAVSKVNKKLHINVSGYGRRMQYGDVLVDFYEGTGLPDEDLVLHIQYTVSLSNASRTGCDVVLPQIVDQEDWLDWIKVTVRNGDGEDPVYTWLKYVPKTAPSTVTFTPDPTGLWNDKDLVFHNSLYLTAQDANGVYLWLVDSDGEMIAQSPQLSDEATLLVDIEESMDPNFSIRYTDAGSFGDTNAPDWDGRFNALEVKHAEYLSAITGELNALTNYDEATGEYTILVPYYEDIGTIGEMETYLAGAEVYYDGNQVDVDGADADGDKPAYDPEDENTWITVTLNAADMPNAGKKAEKWTNSNSKLVILFDDTVNVHVAGADDGVGPRLLSAYVKYSKRSELTLKFSEDLDDDAISTADTKPDIYISNVGVYIRSVAVNPDDASELVLTMNKDVPEATLVNIAGTAGTPAESIMDLNGNPAYALTGNVQVAVERIIEDVNVIGVSRAASTTTIEIVFDKDMDGDDVKDPNSYLIELVPGLEEDKDVDGAAAIVSPVVYTVGTKTATITLDGVIESTAAADLPTVSIVKDIYGGTPEAPLRDSDKAARVPEDKVGPYLKSAAFSYNAENGDSREDCIEQEKVTLTLAFSEKVEVPRLMDDDTFGAVGWNKACLDDRTNSAGVQVEYGVWEVVLTLDKDEATGVNLPYGMTAAFSEDPNIYILSGAEDDIEDDEGNEASDAQYQVHITDATDLWVVEAKTIDAHTTGDAKGVVDQIEVTFGKNININPNKFDHVDKVVSINGDPNIVEDVTESSAYQILIELYEEIDGVYRKVDTAWTPEVSFDLDEDEGIIIEDSTDGERHIVAAFDITSTDGVAPILTNIVDSDEIYAYTKTKPEPGSGDPFTYMVRLEFSEAMDPNIWKEPDYAEYYFDDVTDPDPNVTVVTFLTPDSDPPGTSNMMCGGKKIAVLLETEEEVGVVDMYIDLRGDAGTQEDVGEFTDMAGNPFDPGIRLYLKKGELTDPWSVPTAHKKSIVPTMKSMRIYGKVVEDPNDTEVAGEVYAFHRDELFLIEENDMGDPNKAVFNIDPNRAFGGTAIQDGGLYYIKAYGKESVSGTAQKGFEFGDAVILVVLNYNGSTDSADWTYEIATTACLGNGDYSVSFDGGPTKLPVEHDIDLGQREVINLRTGWNLISTSISGAYVNRSLCTLSGLNADDFAEYMYGPDDPLAGEGSLPAVDEMYEMKDISDVLFTLSHSYFTGNLFYDPATNAIFPVEDELADRFNKTPVFCTGRGYYIYIEDVNAPSGYDHDWKIVLFGEKVPAPEYKLRVAGNTDLIGQWGNLAYYTYDGDTELGYVEGELPSTYAENVFIDDIAGIGDDIAINVCDIDGDAVDMQVVSTFWNFDSDPVVNYPASWYAGMPEFNDLKMVVPGSGYWILIDADATDGPFFVSYMPKPEEED